MTSQPTGEYASAGAERRPFGTWPSPVDAELASVGELRLGEVRADGSDLYWIEGRPEEAGRSTLMRRRHGKTEQLTPAPFNPRSRVHEYGGGAFCVAPSAIGGNGSNGGNGGAGRVFFVHFVDQNLYEVGHGDELRRITDGDSDTRFGDLSWDGAQVLAVREVHPASRDEGAEARNELVQVDVDSGAVTVLHTGHDFYSSPRQSSRERLAFLAWDHPNMPWDGTQLFVADHTPGGALANVTTVAGGVSESVVQPEWDGESLVFAADAGGYWNLFAWDETGIAQILRDDAEYAGPAWGLGSHWYAVAAPGLLVARRVENGRQGLVIVDRERGFASPVDAPYDSFGSLARVPGGIACIGGRANAPSELGIVDIATGNTVVVAGGGALPASQAVVSAAERITFATTAGDCHAWFHPPRNGALKGLPGERPPLLVITHGGPTGSASPDLSWRTQYYTSRGWAVANVDYGGSTGYGRAYRQRLEGAWGVVDVEDCVACVRHLAAHGRVDPARTAIRGGSAGGYTTLAALAFADAFRAGASHYGIGDLKALASDTHKFESRYVDRLVAAEDIEARSPIRHADRIDCPVIFFQGTEDRIVPPNQTEDMRRALAERGVPVARLLFEGEGHGFRRAENIRAAIATEYAFFARVFGFAPPDDVPDFEIENLSDASGGTNAASLQEKPP